MEEFCGIGTFDKNGAALRLLFRDGSLNGLNICEEAEMRRKRESLEFAAYEPHLFDRHGGKAVEQFLLLGPPELCLVLLTSLQSSPLAGVSLHF